MEAKVDLVLENENLVLSPGNYSSKSATESIPPIVVEPTEIKSRHISLEVSNHLRQRTGSSARSRSKSKSGTLSRADFPSEMLSRDNNHSTPKKVPKSVRFDETTMLLHLCQYADQSQDHLNSVKECLGLKDSTTCSINVNMIYSPQQWLTPLHIACSYGHVEVARLLIEQAGAFVNFTDREGWTPLHCACAEGKIEVIKMLVKCQGSKSSPEQGAGKDWIYAADGPINLEPENQDGDIPEEVAMEEKEQEILRILNGFSFFMCFFTSLLDVKLKYPPPPRPPRKKQEQQDSEQEDIDDDSDEEEQELDSEEQSQPTLIPQPLIIPKIPPPPQKPPTPSPSSATPFKIPPPPSYPHPESPHPDSPKIDKARAIASTEILPDVVKAKIDLNSSPQTETSPMIPIQLENPPATFKTEAKTKVEAIQSDTNQQKNQSNILSSAIDNISDHSSHDSSVVRDAESSDAAIDLGNPLGHFN